MICRVLPSGSLGGDARHLRDLSSVALDEDGAAIGVGERSVITDRNTSRLERASRKRPRTTPSRTNTTPPPSSFVTTTAVSPEAHA